jgi:alpha 1,3-glucosidase
VSWYRLGAFTPFFRAHAHIDSIRREPWCFGEKIMKQIREIVLLRYKLLPYIYTQFFLSRNMEYGNFSSIMRPLWFDFPFSN